MVIRGRLEEGQLDRQHQACVEQEPMPPSGQASLAPLSQPGTKGLERRIPLWGLRMEISLIYSPRLPQAFCHRLFVSCSQLVPSGACGPWQSLIGAVPLLQALPLMPTPTYYKRTGERK